MTVYAQWSVDGSAVNPQTGDDTFSMLWILLIVILLAAGSSVLVAKKRQIKQ